MAVIFKVLLSKGAQGEILVNGNYVSGNNPVLVERVILEELDGSGATIGIWTERMMMSIDPSPGAFLLYSSLTYAASNDAVHVALWLMATGVVALVVVRLSSRRAQRR